MPTDQLATGIDRRVTILYTNHRGETADRVISPQYTWFGSTEFHPVNQWFMHAWCYERQAFRDFAMADIKEWRPFVEARKG